MLTSTTSNECESETIPYEKYMLSWHVLISLKYCRYGVKLYPINQSTFGFHSMTTETLQQRVRFLHRLYQFQGLHNIATNYVALGSSVYMHGNSHSLCTSLSSQIPVPPVSTSCITPRNKLTIKINRYVTLCFCRSWKDPFMSDKNKWREKRKG